MLHDVGKIGIPDGILLKPGRLTGPERRKMQEHAELGDRLLAHVPLLNQEGARVIRSHHERWDGERVPRQALRGEHPARRADLRRRRLARRDDGQAALPGSRQLGRRRRGSAPLPRLALRPGRRRRLRGLRARPLPPAHGGADRRLTAAGRAVATTALPFGSAQLTAGAWRTTRLASRRGSAPPAAVPQPAAVDEGPTRRVSAREVRAPRCPSTSSPVVVGCCRGAGSSPPAWWPPGCRTGRSARRPGCSPRSRSPRARANSFST